MTRESGRRSRPVRYISLLFSRGAIDHETIPRFPRFGAAGAARDPIFPPTPQRSAALRHGAVPKHWRTTA